MARGYGDDMNRDRWRDDDRERSSYRGDRDEDRGFFERAGDQLRSWFGDDDERGARRDYPSDPPWNRNQQTRSRPQPRRFLMGTGSEPRPAAIVGTEPRANLRP